MQHKWRYYGLVFLVWVSHAAFTYNPASASVAAERYHLSQAVIILLIATVDLPLLICWLLAATGWLYLYKYVATLPKATDHHRGYQLILAGISVLILSLIVPSFVAAFHSHFIDAELGPMHTWISTYLGLIFPLVGFILASLGSRHLLESLKLNAEPLAKSLTALIPMTVFTIFYLGLIFTNPVRSVSSDPALPATYYMPDILIILTIVLPVIATWAFGFRTVLNLEQYSHYVAPGQKPALVNIYNGALAIVGGIILQQVISSLGSSRATGLNLGLTLTIVYVLLFIIGIGYGFIARGAKQLATGKAPQ